MLFLARHPQFKGKMYQPCEVDDPCFKLDYFHRYEADEVGYEPYWYYTVADIPENCSTFVGVISITGNHCHTAADCSLLQVLTSIKGNCSINLRI